MRILVIAPSSFPVDGAEAIVNIKLLKAFSDDGNFEIDLISKKNKYVTYPSDSIESYNINLNSINIIENQGGFSFKVLVDSLRAFFIFKSIFPGCHWAFRALPLVKKLMNNYRYDIVLTKNSPSFLLGAYIKKMYGLTWVASWNDPYPASFYPAPYGKGKDHKQKMLEILQLRQMRKADFHVFPTRALKEHMKSYLNIEEDVSYVVPHVVIEHDNIINDEEQLKESDCDILRLIHSGDLSSPRSALPVISALSKIIKERPDIKIHFTFLGKMGQNEEHYIYSLPHLKDVVRVLPAVEYKKSLEILATHDVACVIEADCEDGGGVFLPTKVTDFMQIHKPIFAISPKNGVLEDLYNNDAIGYFADVHDESSIYDSLLLIYEDFKNRSIKRSYIPYSFRPNAVVDVYKQIIQKL